MTQTSENRDEAKRFLKGLKDDLDKKLSAADVKLKMQGFVAEAKVEKPKLKDVPHETIFSDKLVVPAIYGYLSDLLPEQDACKALLAEGYLKFKTTASDTPMSTFKHPFTKKFNPVGSIVKSWWGSPSESPVCNACPDFALRSPCPHKVVGETKYFRRGGMDAAKTELVRSIYQCFYYRGLPKAPETKNNPAWDYDYACLLAYDASEHRSLVRAWEKVDAKVEAACWDGANIFVMVLPSA